VLDEGAAGTLFHQGDSVDLARTLLRVLADDDLSAATVERGSQVVRRYDWASVTSEILTVYEMVLDSGAAGGTSRRHVGEDPSSLRGTLGRLVRGDRSDRGDPADRGEPAEGGDAS